MKPAPQRISRRRIGRLFGDLKIRPKLIVLHNTFFLILACAVYFSLIPLFEERAAATRARESALLEHLFAANRPLPYLPELQSYHFQEGSAEELGVPFEVRQWFNERPGQVWRDRAQSEFVYRKLPSGAYRKMRLPEVLYDDTVRQAQINLFVVLGVIYTLAVITLEFLIMPQYVYEPVRKMLLADQATQEGDRARELIPEEQILDDEIGQIMRSRNATVSELRKHEDELARALEDLRRKNLLLENQDRLASIGLLSASVAHEINTPLTVLHGSIEKMMERPQDTVTRERLARMLRVTSRLRTISESLLDFARPRTPQVGPVEVRAIVEEAWSLLALDDKADTVRFVDEVAPDHRVLGNTDRLVQVFLNLLRNALNAVPRGGLITVRSRHAVEDGRGWILISVEDNGPGIPADVLPGIFDAFVSTRLDANGTGLGLTVSEAIVRQHGGVITASNCSDGGARLEVKLPDA